MAKNIFDTNDTSDLTENLAESVTRSTPEAPSVQAARDVLEEAPESGVTVAEVQVAAYRKGHGEFTKQTIRKALQELVSEEKAQRVSSRVYAAA